MQETQDNHFVPRVEVMEKLSGIEARISEIIFVQKEMAKDIKYWADHTKEQNGRIATLEKQEIARVAREAEKDKWEERQARDVKFLIGAAFMAAGVLSAAVFSILQLVTQ